MDEKEQQQETGERMRRAMEGASLTAYDVAERLGVRAPTVYRWLTGQSRPKAETMDEFAALVGRNRVWLEFGPAALDYAAELFRQWADGVAGEKIQGDGLRKALAAHPALSAEFIQRVAATGAELIADLGEIAGAPWDQLDDPGKERAVRRLVGMIDLTQSDQP